MEENVKCSKIVEKQQKVFFLILFNNWIKYLQHEDQQRNLCLPE